MVHVDRRTGLAGLLAGVALLAAFILSRVLTTVFFAITVAYVLYPLTRTLRRRGLERHLAAGASTAVAFLGAVLLVTPVGFVLYRRRGALLAFIRAVPTQIPVTVFDVSFVVDLSTVATLARGAVISVAVQWARVAPVLALKAFLFTFLVYALLLRPTNVGTAVFKLVPSAYHDVVVAIHRRIRNTLYAIYVLQAATAFGTFVVAYVVFWSLGYDGALALAVVAGVLQFIPVIGPSVVVVALAAVDLLSGDVPAAALVITFGLVFVGFLPDALIRPRLASITAEMPGSLYFVGFTGGVLSLGLIGFIAGPLIVAVLVEVVDLVSNDHATVQTTLDARE
ncbi:MAG: AI-2E family transporter [Haloarculaceae archaeon]